MNCRHCSSPVDLPFLDLGSAPPSNAYLQESDLSAPESWYPLRVGVCQSCWLVQTEDFAQREELFRKDYAYLSAVSKSWLEHSERYVETAVGRLGLNSDSRVIEVAANDGYLLQYVLQRGIPCLGIEPTSVAAGLAREKGIEVEEAFFGRELADQLVKRGLSADLMVGNNVLAHVPDINDFLSGFTLLLKPKGLVSFEFPHLLRMVEGCQFDTVYHEHFSYLSLTALENVFATSGLLIVDVEELPTHGGSLRVWAGRADNSDATPTAKVAEMLEEERTAGLGTAGFYTEFQGRAEKVKNGFLKFLLEARESGKIVAAYGAAAKGNTLLNFAGVRPDLLEYVVDRSPAKVGTFLPGSRIPVVDESIFDVRRPDYLIILPWNIKDEVCAQLADLGKSGTSFVTAVPELQIL